MKPQARSPLVIAMFALALASPARAQGPNTFSVSRLTDLTFGIVVAGTSVTIDASSPGAGEFLITGPKRSLATLTFSMPTELTGPGSRRQAVSFTAAWSDVNVPAGAVGFNPRAGAQLTMPNSRNIYVWIGGSLDVNASQPAGDYAGTITLSVVLN